MIVADYVVDFIAREGVNEVFELVGGAITYLVESVYNNPKVTCISVHHEQTAAFAAEAYARMNGRLGVAMATSGPGALNLVTGIGSCYFDSVPCLFITGQVNTYEYKFDRPIRQVGFQETDIVSVVQPLTKYCNLLTDPRMIRYQLEKAVFIARCGRPGPVLLDLPMDVQRAAVEPQNLASFYDSREYQEMKEALPYCPTDVIETVRQLLATAKRPIILAGGGVRTANAVAELASFVELTGIPVVTSLMGLDIIDHQHPAFSGMIGIYANRYSNLVIANSDLILILGSRLDSRQTGTKPATFARAAVKVHVDVDPNELNAKVPADLAVNCDLKDFLVQINFNLVNTPPLDLTSWRRSIQHFKSYCSQFDSCRNLLTDPNRLLEILSKCTGEKDTVILDVGQNQMWAAQSFQLKKGQRMLISGGMGAMGFAVAGAIGAALAAPERKVIVIVGDGGIQVNLQELDIIAARQLPVKIFVFNNHCLGMVRQFQDYYFAGRQQSTVLGYHCPDLVRIAAAYGFTVFTQQTTEGAAGLFQQALDTNGPVLVNIELGQNTVVEPKLLVNQPLEEMSPSIPRDELQKLMLIDLVGE